MLRLEQNYDVVIAGAGAAGLYAALHLPAELNVLVLAKREATLCNSALAQGGIVSVIPEINPKDSIESHIKDTLVSGCGLNDINTVRFVSEQSAQAIDDLIRNYEKDKLSERKQEIINFLVYLLKKM